MNAHRLHGSPHGTDTCSRAAGRASVRRAPSWLRPLALWVVGVLPTVSPAGTASIPLIPTDWTYRWDRCVSGGWNFTSEGAAVADMLAAYQAIAAASGCRLTATNDGWPVTPVLASGSACGGSSSAEVPITRSSIEIYNRELWHMDFSAATDSSTCSWSESPSLYRNRDVRCPDGYAAGPDGSCVPNGGLNPGKTAGPPRCGHGVGDPCDAGSGNNYQSRVDYAGGGPFPLRFVRSYNSYSYDRFMDNTRHMLGAYWSASYLSAWIEHIVSAGLETAIVHRPDGKVLFFTLTAGIWTPDSDIDETLSQTPNGWVYALRDGTRETYEQAADGLGTARARLVTIANPAGLTQQLHYDSVTGRLVDVTGAFGRTLRFDYDSSGRLKTLTVPGGDLYEYTYDADNNLASVTAPDGATRSYRYHEDGHTGGASGLPHHITGIIDANGQRAADFHYTAVGSIARTELAVAQRQFSLTYGTTAVANINETTITSGNGASEVRRFERRLGVPTLIHRQRYDAAGNPVNGPLEQVFDADNNLTCRRDEAGHVTLYTYNATHQRLSMTEGMTGDCAVPRATRATRATGYRYLRPTLNLPIRIRRDSVAPGADFETLWTYADVRHPTLPTRIERRGFAPDGTPVSRIVSLTYDSAGLLIRRDGPRTDVADVTSFAYDAQGNLVAVTNPLGQVTRYTSHDAHGRPLASIDPNGISTTITYDSAGRVTARTVAGATTTYAYDPAGNLVGITLPGPVSYTLSYNAADELIQVTDGAGSDLHYILDAMGNRIRREILDPAGTAVAARRNVFDAANRLAQAIDALSHATLFEYDGNGNATRVTDPRGNTSVRVYDALDRLEQVTDPLNGTTRYAHDPRGALTALTDPNGNTTRYARDDLGNLRSVTSPDTGTTVFNYDAAGNVTARVDARGQVFTYAYDALNRLVRLDAPGTSDDVVYTYDSCPNGIGRLCAVSNSAGTVDYAYDAFGNVTAHQGVAYAYDAPGRIRRITYPSGAVAAYYYDVTGRVGQVTLTVAGMTHNLASAITYAPFGPLRGLTYGNGLHLDQTYDAEYQTSTQVAAGALDLSYDRYDAAGNLEARTDRRRAPALSETFTYDPLDRLTRAANGTTVRTYTYDANGNRIRLDTNASPTSYSYEAGSDRLLQSGMKAVALDPNGNTIQIGTSSYTYGALDQLTEARAEGALLATYTYNGLGQRRTKALPGGPGREFVYGTAGALLAERDAAGHILAEYIYLNGTVLAKYEPDADHDGLTNLQEQGQFGSDPDRTDTDADTLPDGTEALVYGTDPVKADTDGDGVRDDTEISAGTDPLLASSHPGDGDLTDNGALDAGDYIVLSRIVLHLRVATATELTHGDLNGDGALDTRDLLLLARRLLHLTALPTSALAVVIRTHRAPLHLAAAGTPTAIAPPSGDGRIYYYHNDHLGTPKALTDENATPVWRADYTPFGHATVDEDPDANGILVTNPIRFPGQYYDTETGLHYNYFRDYNPTIGRYLEGDPIRMEGKLNIYSYVANNPLRWVDPLGLDKTVWWNTGGGRNPINGPTNGNWGGKCWSGGTYSCGGNPDGSALPTDSADACYMAHDKCYEQPSCTTAGKSSGGSALRACDARLVQCLKNLPKNPKDWPSPPRTGTERDSQSYKNGAIWLFSH